MLSISYSKLTTKKLDYLGEQTIILSEQNNHSEVTSNVLFQQVKTVHADYRVVVMKQTYSGMGAEVAAEDLTRDSFDLGLRKIINGYAAFTGSYKQEYALLLQKIFDQAGSITQLSYAEESIVIGKILEKLSVSDAKNAISALGIDEEVGMLQESQNRFNSLYTEQVDANSDLRQQSSATKMRKQLEDALRAYYGLVSAMSNVEPWKDIYSDLNELLKKF